MIALVQTPALNASESVLVSVSKVNISELSDIMREDGLSISVCEICRSLNRRKIIINLFINRTLSRLKISLKLNHLLIERISVTSDMFIFLQF